MREIVIVGGGASGLVSAIKIKTKYNNVTIIEREDVCGKKILVTGNGRCNYYNEDQSIENYYSSNSELLKKIITDNNTSKVISFFNDLGIVYKIKNGYYYPFSNQASTIRSVLLEEIKRLNIKVINNCFVEKINKDNDRFIIYTNKDKIEADDVVISIGSKACISKKYMDKHFNILTNFKHKVIEPLPALVPLMVNFPYLKDWDGVRSSVIVRLMEDGNELGKEEGEIQLTNYGISGICVFNLSRLAIRGLYSKKREEVIINFLPFIKTKKEFYELLEKYDSNLEISKILDRILNYKLVNAILKYSSISKDKKYCDLEKEEIESLANNLLSLKLQVVGNKDFNSAQVSSGGISLEDVDLNTMESKHEKNLYFTGEILDVDGKCGGYNLTFAFLTAILVGEHLRRKND